MAIGMVGMKIMAPTKVIMLVMRVMIMDLEVMKVMAVAMGVMMIDGDRDNCLWLW